MAAYYLMAQLPSLDGLGESAPPPITEERFLQLCGSFLGKKARRGLRLADARAAAGRLESTGLGAGRRAGTRGERELRLALGAARAERMKKTFDAEDGDFPAELLKAARTAAAMENPMEAEQFLCRYRLAFLESLRPMDLFCRGFRVLLRA